MYEKKIRFMIRKTIKKQWFYWFVIVLVFLNTFAVAVEHYNQPRWLSEFLHITEFFFLALFIFEMLLRMWALGPRIYYESSFNRFDCLVISGSVFEVVLTHFNPKSGSFGLSVLRALRLLRIFKVSPLFFFLNWTPYFRSLKGDSSKDSNYNRHLTKEPIIVKGWEVRRYVVPGFFTDLIFLFTFYMFTGLAWLSF